MLFQFGTLPDLKFISLTRRNTSARLSIVCLLAGLLCGPLALADQRAPLTIVEAEDLALRGEPGQNELRSRAEALGEQAVAAGQLPDPTLRFGIANYPISGGGFSTEGMTQAQLGIRQALPRGSLRSLRSRQFEAMATAQFSNADARADAVLEAARSAWLEAFYWQNVERILSESRPLFENLLSTTASMYEVGRKSQSDVLRAELEVLRLDDRSIEASRSRAAAQGALSEWLGSEAFRPIANKLPDWSQLPAIDELRTNLARHPMLDAAAAQIEARQARVGIAEEKAKPGWAVDVGYGYRNGTLSNGDPRSDFVSVSFVVDLPVNKKNRQDRDLAAALSERRAAISGKQRIAAQLNSQLNVEYRHWTDLTRRLALYETDILELSNTRVEAAMLAYQSDAGDFSDVMLGQIDALNTRLDFVRLQVERAQAFTVLANLGGIPR